MALTRAQRDINVARFAGEFFEGGKFKRFFDEDRDDSRLPSDVQEFIKLAHQARTEYFLLAGGTTHYNDAGKIVKTP